MVRGDLGDHLAPASQESWPEPHDTLDLGAQLHLLVYALVSSQDFHQDLKRILASEILRCTESILQMGRLRPREWKPLVQA